MVNVADGWNYIETCFVVWKCKDCNFHFAVAESNVCEGNVVKCPVCSQEHSYEEKTEEVEVVIDYYG